MTAAVPSPRTFRAGRFWLLTMAALLLTGLTFSLGQWQLRRAAQKQALQVSIERQSTLPVLDAPALETEKNWGSLLHRRADLQGSWRPEHTVYLDNRPMSGKTGFVVLTPLVLEGSTQVILVQRGWVPRNFTDRTRLPEISTPTGPVTVGGRIAPPPSKLYEFQGGERGRIRQNLDMSGFAGEIAMPLLPLALLQTGAASEGLLRDWAAPTLGVDKHYGYAFQWFGLCALVVGLYAWFQLILPLRARLRNQRRDPRQF